MERLNNGRNISAMKLCYAGYDLDQIRVSRVRIISRASIFSPARKIHAERASEVRKTLERNIILSHNLIFFDRKSIGKRRKIIGLR